MRRDRVYLIHILECIERIELYTGAGENGFFSDTKTQDAVIRNLQPLAEPTQRLSSSIKLGNPSVDWRNLSSFRNVAVHNYLGKDLVQIWGIVQRNILGLKILFQDILREQESAP